MKNLQILIALALIAYLAHGESFGGVPNITIYGNEDPDSCTLTLTMDVQAEKIVFNEVVNNTNESCTYQNLHFAPVFREDGLGSNITLVPKDDGTYSGEIPLSAVQENNGTYCGKIRDNGAGADFWACRFKYGEIYFVIALFLNRATNQLETTWTDVLYPDLNTNVSTDDDLNLVTPNATFPQLVGRLPNSNNSTDNTVSNLSQPVYVTGTVLMSNQVNLTNYLSDAYLVGVGVRKPDNSYKIYTSSTPFYPFAESKQGPNNTTDTGLVWDQLIDSLNDCVEGCQVTFVVQNGTQVEILQTGGVTTKPARRLRG